MDVYGLIGNPVGHSLSPPMHEAAYEALDIDARYVTFEPAKGSASEAIASAQVLGIAGLNVTIPFKQDVLSSVEPDPLAKQVGAVNTIVFNHGTARGYNTDVSGAIRAMSHHSVTMAGAKALVIGAGGAGRAIAFGLADAGASVAIANRTKERAVHLATEIDSATGHGSEEIEELLSDCDILVNATSVGMESTETPVDAAWLHSELTVMDAVYRPITTTLLADAAKAGATTIDGAWMLLFQGAEAFERWTGEEAPIATMDEALRSALG